MAVTKPLPAPQPSAHANEDVRRAVWSASGQPFREIGFNWHRLQVVRAASLLLLFCVVGSWTF